MSVRRIAVVSMAVACLIGCASNKPPKPPRETPIAFEPVGQMPDGQAITAYTLKNNKVSVRILDLGATIQSLTTLDRDDVAADIVLGFDNAADYLKPGPYFGATVGRYANRIAGGRFSLDGKSYVLPINNEPNSLHGGVAGFDKKLWTAKSMKPQRKGESSIQFVLISPDGDEGYPGELRTTVTYTLTRDDSLRIEYEAITDQPTVLNLTNHSYFNLTGDPAANTVERHVVTIDADAYTPGNAVQIPTGEIKPVAGTPFDFRTPRGVGDRLPQTGGDPAGYDHNYVLNGGDTETPRLVATATDPGNGRSMEVWTTEPGLQFYTGNFLDGMTAGKNGVKYSRHSGLCFETQHFPDSPNQSKFPSTALRPGEVFRSTTIYKFGQN